MERIWGSQSCYTMGGLFIIAVALLMFLGTTDIFQDLAEDDVELPESPGSILNQEDQEASYGTPSSEQHAEVSGPIISHNTTEKPAAASTSPTISTFDEQADVEQEGEDDAEVKGREGTIIVTGGAGEIGVTLAKHFVSLGFHVALVDLVPQHLVLGDFKNEQKLPSNKTQCAGQRRLEYFVADVRHSILPVLNTVCNVRGVIHLAGVRLDKCIEGTEQLCSDILVNGTKRVLHDLTIHAKKHNSSYWFILPSFCEKTDNKLLQEALTSRMEILRAEKLDRVITSLLHLGDQVYGTQYIGPNEHPVVPRMLLAAMRATPFFVVPDIDYQIMHVSEMIDALLHIISDLEQREELDCVEYQIQVEVVAERIVAKMVLELTNSSSDIIALPAHGSMPLVSFCSSSAARVEIRNIQAKIGLREGLALYYDQLQRYTLDQLQEDQKLCPLPMTVEDINTKIANASSLELQEYQIENLHAALSLLNITTTTSHPCYAVFRPTKYNGLSPPCKVPPICTNNDRWGECPDFCRDTGHAIEFMRSGSVYKPEWLKSTCGPNSTYSNLPVCDFSCRLPTQCVQTGRCRCVEMHRCPARFSFPNITDFVEEWKKHQSPPDPDHDYEYSKLINLVTKPLVHALNGHPKINIIPMNIEDVSGCKGLRTAGHFSCFNVVARLMEVIENRSTTFEEADYFLIPYHERCSHEKNAPKYREEADKFIAAHNTQGKHVRLLEVHSHDWGRCMGGGTNALDRRGGREDRSPPYNHGVHVIQINGDTNTNCYQPAMDVLVPPQTCFTEQILAWGQKPLPLPIERNTSIYWQGSISGTATWLRSQITCQGIYTPGHHVLANTDRKFGPDYRYQIQHSRFCLGPQGTTGWTTRNIDILSMGCIPVYLSDYTVYGFQELLDFTKFALFLPEVEVSLLDEKVVSMPDADINELYYGLLIARSSFVYANGTVPMSPVDLMLRSLYKLRHTISGEQYLAQF